MQVRILCVASAIGAAHGLQVSSRSPSMAFSAGKRTAAAASVASPQGPLFAAPIAEERGSAMHLRGGADANTLVFALFKAIVGSGVLCLAGGMAAFTNDTAMIPAGV